jgi:chaperonin GroES
MLDLDLDGYPEPYVVTTTKDGQVARIVPCFGPAEITVETTVGLMSLDEIQQGPIQAKRIISIKRRQYFTKYGFIPAPDGSFYDIGFGKLLEDLSEPINVAINQMLDAGSLQNAGGGFLGSGINHRGGNVTFRLGEWKRIDVANSGPIRDQIFRLEHPGPSPVLFQLLGFLVGAGKEITAVQDVMTGEGTANQPATTTLALIEQGHKVMTAIFKRIHRSFGRELQILRRLNRDYLDEEEYFQLNDADGGQISRKDYEDSDLDVMPASDPSVATDMQKMTRSEVEWTSFNGDPLVNQVELRRRRMETLGIHDAKALLSVPQPPPDPKLLIEGMKAAREKLEAHAKVRASDAKAALDALNAAKIAYDMGLLQDAANLTEAAIQLGATIDDELAAGGGDVPQLEGPTPDPGVSPVPGGPSGEPDAGMGVGPPELAQPGIAGAGGPAGPTGGDQF